jgi:hypothetical protein
MRRSATARVTRCVSEKITQNNAQLTFVKINSTQLFQWKKYTTNFGHLFNFQKLPRENFAQSGHPVEFEQSGHPVEFEHSGHPVAGRPRSWQQRTM